MKRTLAIVCGVLLCLQAVATETNDIPYNKYYSRLAEAKKVDPEGKVRIMNCLQPAEKDKALPANLAIEIVSGNDHISLTLDEDHCFQLPLNEEWSKLNAVLRRNTPEHLVMSMGVLSRPPKATSLSYEELTESVPAYEKVRGSQGLLARMFFPNAKGLIVVFGKESKGNVVVHAGDGDKNFVADAEGIVHLPYEPKWNAARVELSGIPKTMAPDMAN